MIGHAHGETYTRERHTPGVIQVASQFFVLSLIRGGLDQALY